MNDPTTEIVCLRAPDPGATARQHVRAMLLIALVVGSVGYFDLGRRELLNSLETGYALTVQEMVRDGQWLVPSLNGRPRLVKPPLPFWISAAVCKVLHGDRAPLATLRAVSIFTAIIAAWLVYALGCRMFDRRAALWAAIVWATCFIVVYETRYARHDIYLVAAVHLAMLGIYMAWQRERLGWWITLAGLVLAFQVKGPVSWLLTVVPTLAFVLLQRPIRWRFIAGLIAMMLLGGLSLLPWIIAVDRAVAFDVVDLYRWEAIDRVVSENAPWVPPWYYVQYVAYVLPWTAYLVAGLVVPFDRNYAARRQPLRFAWLWLVIGLAAMSIPREKTARYVVPLIAPGALLIGQVLSFHVDLWRRRLRDPGALPLWVGHGVLVSVAAVVLPVLAATQYGFGLPLALAMGVPLLIAGGACVMLMPIRRDAWRGAIASAVFAALFTMAFFYANQYAPGVHEAYQQKAVELNAIVPRDEHLISWPDQPPYALIFFADRTAPTIANTYFAQQAYAGRSDLDINAVLRAPDRNAKLLDLWLGDHRERPIFVIVPGEAESQLVARAEAAGLAARTVLDLTTPEPRKPSERRDPLAVVRLAPVTPSPP